MLLKLDYGFAPLSLSFFFLELEILFPTYFIRHTLWFTSLIHLNKKYRK